MRAQPRWAPQVPRLRVSMALDVTKLDLRSGAVPAASSFLQQAGTVTWPPGAPNGSVTLQLLNSGNLTVRANPHTLPVSAKSRAQASPGSVHVIISCSDARAGARAVSKHQRVGGARLLRLAERRVQLRAGEHRRADAHGQADLRAWRCRVHALQPDPARRPRRQRVARDVHLCAPPAWSGMAFPSVTELVPWLSASASGQPLAWAM